MSDDNASREESEFVALTRLAWRLRWLGRAVCVELPADDQPCVRLSRGCGTEVRIVVAARVGRPTFRWGRGTTQWVDLGDPAAAATIHRAVR
ncbi:hypothetical protein DP939_41225 [Spongiactinospora rosea]|uniref:Uncharacterized protein n=1 Tax=Spongiactinospora rosea TaxID=2248750 RepID=A0A366LL29_9ACTN|nr:hypothetical protein [Spongiactinospora rosea]RBQ14380.1 hypothetical protein DP939_41225 [Spongiactinospora rosea]